MRVRVRVRVCVCVCACVCVCVCMCVCVSQKDNCMNRLLCYTVRYILILINGLSYLPLSGGGIFKRKWSLPVNIAAIRATPNAMYHHDMLMFECVSLQVSLNMNHLFSQNMIP